MQRQESRPTSYMTDETQLLATIRRFAETVRRAFRRQYNNPIPSATLETIFVSLCRMVWGRGYDFNTQKKIQCNHQYNSSPCKACIDDATAALAALGAGTMAGADAAAAAALRLKLLARRGMARSHVGGGGQNSNNSNQTTLSRGAGRRRALFARSSGLKHRTTQLE